MLTFIAFMKVSELMEYREFDRVATPTPLVGIFQTYTVWEVVEWVKLNGIDIYKPLELSICNDKALLTDGNHRIAAASILKLDSVPVKINIYEDINELTNVFYPQTISRFKKVSL